MMPPGGHGIDLEGLSINKPLPLPLPAGAPAVTSEGVVYTDITNDFFKACQALKPGDVVKSPGFTLLDSVGSLEIGDPKMDSGLLAPGETLHDEYDVTRPLLPSEVIGIIDQLLCLEMAWHLGYPLSQTLFTSICIEAMLNPTPQSLEDARFTRDPDRDSKDPMLAVLRAYCLGLVKSCSYVSEIIRSEFFYEEEDFVTNTFSLSLLDSIDRYDIREEIMAARASVHNLRHDITSDMAQALGFRLELRTAFLRALELSELRCNPDSQSLPWTQMKAIWEPISKSHALGTPVPEAFSTKIQRRLVSTVPPRPIVHLGFEEASENFKNLFLDGIELLNVLHFTDAQSLLTFVMSFQAKKPQPLVFIRTLLQSFLFKDMRVLGSLSIRTLLDDDLSIVVLPASPLIDPANDLIEATHDPRHAVAFQMESFRQRVAQSYLDMFRTFCQNRCRVRRTLCHAIQGWENVQMDAEEVDQLVQYQINFASSSAAIPAGHQASTSQPQGPHPETGPHALPLSSWAFLYKLRMMEWIVQVGFELEIYQNDELAGMYWYLSWLAKTRVCHIQRIHQFTVAERNLRRSSTWKVNHAVASNATGASGAFASNSSFGQNNSNNSSNNNNDSNSNNNNNNTDSSSSGGNIVRSKAIAAGSSSGSSSSSSSSISTSATLQHTPLLWPTRWRPPLTPGDEVTFSRSLGFLGQATDEASATQHLADALSSLYTALRRLGLVTAPPRPYSSEALRFDVRMKPFAAIGLPEQPDHARFAAATLQASTPTARLLDYADRALARAGRSCEALARLASEVQGGSGSGSSNKPASGAGAGAVPPPGCHAGEGRVLGRWLDGVKGMRDAVGAAGAAVGVVRRALESVEGWEGIVDADVAKGTAEGGGNEVASGGGDAAAAHTDDRKIGGKGKAKEEEKDVDAEMEDKPDNGEEEEEEGEGEKGVQGQEAEQQQQEGKDQQHQQHQQLPNTHKLGPEAFGIKAEIPRPDEGHHEWWIVPRIIETKK